VRLVVAVALPLAVSGCGGTSKPGSAVGGTDVVPVVERDFQITLPLPLRGDGITIDEEKLGRAEIGSLGGLVIR